MNIFLDSAGCRLNQSEIESFARQFRADGHALVGSAEQADLVVVNTCTVTAQAASDSRQKIRQAAHQGAKNIVVTGCWATLEPGEALALPGVSHVIGNMAKDTLVSELLNRSFQDSDLELIPRQILPGTHQRTRAFIKVQDGCDNRCTYCITCLARGPSRSRPFRTVLQDIQAALTGGCREIVLTGVHLGAWGADLQPIVELRDLIQAILAQTDLPRLRLSSLEPWDLDQHFFDLWQDSRLCRHLHLPLQSGSAATLKRMARKNTPEEFATLVHSARQAIPELAITTDIIVGFPGESDLEFTESINFIKAMEFAGGHVFRYSSRPGTAAAQMSGQVHHDIRKLRNFQVRNLFAQAAQAYQAKWLGHRVPVLWERAQADSNHTWQLSGITDTYCRVTTQADTNLHNQISQVVLTAQTERGLQGIIYDKGQVQ